MVLSCRWKTGEASTGRRRRDTTADRAVAGRSSSDARHPATRNAGTGRRAQWYEALAVHNLAEDGGLDDHVRGGSIDLAGIQ